MFSKLLKGRLNLHWDWNWRNINIEGDMKNYIEIDINIENYIEFDSDTVIETNYSVSGGW